MYGVMYGIGNILSMLDTTDYEIINFDEEWEFDTWEAIERICKEEGIKLLTEEDSDKRKCFMPIIRNVGSFKKLQEAFGYVDDTAGISELYGHDNMQILLGAIELLGVVKRCSAEYWDQITSEEMSRRVVLVSEEEDDSGDGYILAKYMDNDYEFDTMEGLMKFVKGTNATHMYNGQTEDYVMIERM